MMMKTASRTGTTTPTISQILLLWVSAGGTDRVSTAGDRWDNVTYRWDTAEMPLRDRWRAGEGEVRHLGSGSRFVIRCSEVWTHVGQAVSGLGVRVRWRLAEGPDGSEWLLSPRLVSAHHLDPPQNKRPPGGAQALTTLLLVPPETQQVKL